MDVGEIRAIFKYSYSSSERVDYRIETGKRRVSDDAFRNGE